MADPSDPYRLHLVAIRDLGADELRVLTALADRLSMGQRQYGRLDLLHDARDYLRERHEEVLDAAIYEVSHAVRADMVARAATDPCPPPFGELDLCLPPERDTEPGT